MHSLIRMTNDTAKFAVRYNSFDSEWQVVELAGSNWELVSWELASPSRAEAARLAQTLGGEYVGVAYSLDE